MKNVIVSDDINSNARVLHRNEISGVCNLSKDGAYDFSGKANISTLYSDHYFNGKSSVEYRLENYSDSTLTVKIYKKSNWFIPVKTLTMKAHKKGGGFIDLDKNTEYFLEFKAPSYFYGYVK